MINRLMLCVAGIILIYLFYGCSRSKTTITALCEQDDKGDYIIKWELYPDRDDAVLEIYASGNDSIFPTSPTKTTAANKYIEVVDDCDSLNYRFFRIKVSGSTSDVISNRFFELDSIHNFRDLGGYRGADNRQVRWGRVFRSGHMGFATSKDKNKLTHLNLKTIIDFRPNSIVAKHPDKLEVANQISIPIAFSSYDQTSDLIIKGIFYKGDAVIHTQDLYRDIVENYSKHYAKFFDILAEKENYPLVFHCSLGKDQSGIASYFLLRALGVSTDTSEDDYAFSNIGIRKHKLVQGADTLSESRQEALTMLTRTDPAYLRYAISCIRTKYGSVDDYMTKELQLTEEKKQRLRDILLY